MRTHKNVDSQKKVDAQQGELSMHAAHAQKKIKGRIVLRPGGQRPVPHELVPFLDQHWDRAGPIFCGTFPSNLFPPWLRDQPEVITSHVSQLRTFFCLWILTAKSLSYFAVRKRPLHTAPSADMKDIDPSQQKFGMSSHAV